MKAIVKIDAGICGFQITAKVTSEDSQNVKFDIDTNCENIRQLSQILGDKGLIDAYQEISPAGPAVIMCAAGETIKGCCTGCAVPVGLFKAMQVATGLALPKDINIRFVKED